MNANPSKMMNYIGPSMNPTLKPGDGLRVLPYGDREIRIGDVVVVRSPTGNKQVVHRIISLESGHIRTRGDNNNKPDSWVLHPDDIAGRVICTYRGNKRIPVHGGARGRINCTVFRAIKLINSKVSLVLSPLYHSLARSGILRNLISQRMKTQVVCIRRSNCTEMQLHLGRRIIGRRLPGQNRWHIVRPFRLFIDEATLP
jgi:signal peptidase I